MIDAITTLEVSTLGRFEVRRDQEPLTGGNWSRRKVVDLFKLLLSVEQHRLHREQVQEILWPNSPIEQAANSFGKTLYLLRRALEPDLAAGKGSSSIYVLLDHDTLMLVPGSLKIDADVFESSTKQVQIKMRNRSGKETENQNRALLDEFDPVLALYHGDYLPEDLYEDWTQRRRDRLRRIHSWLLENAAELALAIGEGLHASEYLLELLERNSADEQTHRQLMLVYARMGRRSDALNQYLLLRKALREELRTSPLPETNELFRRIQMGQVPVDLRESKGSISTVTWEEAPSRLATKGYNLPEVNTGGLRLDIEVEEQAVTRRLDPDRILKAALVGREDEIARLQRAFNQARAGQRRAVFLCGEPGIGKSRLARDFTRWGEETQQAIVLWGYCYEMSGLLPYQPIADAISAHVQNCSPEQLRAMLGASAIDLAKIAPGIRLKLPELPQPEPLGPEVERRNLYNAVARFFNVLAAQRSLILILDDLQWADAATVHLLNYLTLQGGSSPFGSVTTADRANAVPLYLLLYRAGEVYETHPLRGLIAALQRGGMGEELRLQRLNEEQVQQLLVNMARHPVTPAFAGEIYRHTEGNPFFIGEAIRSLILEGKIKWTGERWQSTVKVTALELPQSVRLLIERRLVNLTPQCRTTLALAAVLGRQFSSALLCQAHTLSEEVIAEHIDNAIQVQILSSLVGSGLGRGDVVNYHHGQDIDLTFTHDKIREVLYQWLNPLRRRTLHHQVAQAIEVRYAAHLQPYYSQLGYHYQMAEDYAKAVDYLLKAAEHARSVYAFVDAGNYVQAALELLIGDEERSRRAALLHQLANIYLYTGQLDDAMKAGLAACSLWRDLGEVVKQAETYLDVAFFCHWQGRELEAIKYIQCALECIAALQDQTALLAKAYAQWGLAATIMGEAPQALEKLRRADELRAKAGGDDVFISVVSLWARAWYAFLAEAPGQMLEYALIGVEVCCNSHKPDWEPMMNYSAAWAHMLLGRIPAGEKAARDALERAQQYGVVGAQGWAYLALAFLAIQAGRWDDARQMGEKAYQIAALLHDADLQARVLWSRSVCAGWQGDWEHAIADILEALQLAKIEGETSMVYPHLLIQAAKAYFHAGKPETAQSYLDQGMQLALSRHYRQLPAIGQRLQGRIWQAQGRFEEAQPCFERSLAAFLAIEDAVEHARTEEAYGLFFLARDKEGDMERGQALLKSAQATFNRLGVNG
ncbi:MAG TPA: AAA family ATPase [Ktedonobacteraceae bacterium]|nr:AAA family ATPase [Ktedonobacteraceae bacterium]